MTQYPTLVQEVAEARRQLSLALRATATEIRTMHTRCNALRETVRTLGQPSASYRAKEAAWRRIAVLTPRELEVLKAIAEGQSSKEVAYRLHITFKTAVCHRTRLMQKLGVHETASLVRLALTAGLVPPAEAAYPSGE